MECRELRVSGRAVREVDLEAPRECGRSAEQLLVEVVAPASDRLGEHDTGRDRVHEDEAFQMTPVRDHQHRDEPAADGAQIDRPPFQISKAPTTPPVVQLYPVNR